MKFWILSVLMLAEGIWPAVARSKQRHPAVFRSHSASNLDVWAHRDASSESSESSKQPSAYMYDGSCPQPNGLFGYPGDCRSFVTCANGRGCIMNCPPGTIFNLRYLVCTHSSLTKCIQDKPNYDLHLTLCSAMHNPGRPSSGQSTGKRPVYTKPAAFTTKPFYTTTPSPFSKTTPASHQNTARPNQHAMTKPYWMGMYQTYFKPNKKPCKCHSQTGSGSARPGQSSGEEESHGQHATSSEIFTGNLGSFGVGSGKPQIGLSHGHHVTGSYGGQVVTSGQNFSNYTSGTYGHVSTFGNHSQFATGHHITGSGAYSNVSDLYGHMHVISGNTSMTTQGTHGSGHHSGSQITGLPYGSVISVGSSETSHGFQGSGITSQTTGGQQTSGMLHGSQVETSHGSVSESSHGTQTSGYHISTGVTETTGYQTEESSKEWQVPGTVTSSNSGEPSEQEESEEASSITHISSYGQGSPITKPVTTISNLGGGFEEQTNIIGPQASGSAEMSQTFTSGESLTTTGSGEDTDGQGSYSAGHTSQISHLGMPGGHIITGSSQGQSAIGYQIGTTGSGILGSGQHVTGAFGGNQITSQNTTESSTIESNGDTVAYIHGSGTSGSAVQSLGTDSNQIETEHSSSQGNTHVGLPNFGFWPGCQGNFNVPGSGCLCILPCCGKCINYPYRSKIWPKLQDGRIKKLGINRARVMRDPSPLMILFRNPQVHHLETLGQIWKKK